MHPHGCTQIRHEHQTNSHWEYKQGLLVLLTSACVKPITGHLEHGPRCEQQVGPCGLNELLSVTNLTPTWLTSVSTSVG